MSTEINVEGNIGQIKVEANQNGDLRTFISIASQRRKKNRNTDSWEDDGPVIWFGATFWNEEAQRLGDLLQKGDRVKVSGGIRKRTWDGGEALEITNPTLWSHRPKQSQINPGINHTGANGYPADNYTGQGTGGPQNGSWDTASSEAPF